MKKKAVEESPFEDGALVDWSDSRPYKKLVLRELGLAGAPKQAVAKVQTKGGRIDLKRMPLALRNKGKA